MDLNFFIQPIAQEFSEGILASVEARRASGSGDT
jgi:hypothetical protein